MALRKSPARLILLFGVATGIARPISNTFAQAPQPAQPPIFGSSVTLVAVPVFVTDKNGKSVQGLTADDFEVEADGKRTSIAFFQAIDAGESTPVAVSTDVAVPDLPIAVKAAAPRQFLVLLDLVFSPLSGVVRVRKEAAEFIKTALAPGDLVATAVFNQAGLKVLTNFTSDHAFAARAISGIGFSESSVVDPLGLGGSLSTTSGNARADQDSAEQDRALERVERSASLMRASDFIDGMAELVKKISPLRGRKQIVLLSGGFAENAWSPTIDRGRPDDSGPAKVRLEDLFRKAGEGDVVIHTINLAGIEGPIDLTSKSGRDDSLRGDTLNGSAPPTLDIITLRKTNSGRDTLSYIASGTGGRAILPGNNFGQLLGEVEQISRHSYVIAFEAPEPTGKSEKPRKLKVRIRRPGLSVSHRPTYFATPAVTSMSADGSRLQAAEAISKGLNTGPLNLNLVTLPYANGEGETRVYALLQIDGPAFASAASGSQIAVQVYGYLMDSGRVVDSMTLNTSIDLGKAGARVRESGLRLITAFSASPGTADLRFAVRAGTGDATGSIQRSVAIPAFTDGTPFVSVPMFTLPAAGKAVVAYQAKDRPPIPIPFFIENERFIPDAAVTLRPGRSSEVVVFSRPARSTNAAQVEVAGEIGKAGLAFMPVKVEETRVVRDRDGFDRIVFHVTVPDLLAGNYVIRFVLRESPSGMRQQLETSVRVEREAGR
ncbi:MAG: VWA domain-containing protein [Vicinamibacteria bacterium]